MTRKYDPGVVRVLDALDLDARGWVVLDDSYAESGEIRIGARATPDRLVDVETSDDEDTGRYFYSLDIRTGRDPTEFIRDYELVETGYNATLDEVIAAAERHLDPNREPDTRVRKDRTILALLAKLDLEKRGWIVTDEWEDDLVSIGIGVPDNPYHLVWMATHTDKPGRYTYDCETPTGPDPTDYKVVDEAEHVSFDELVAAMERHLGRMHPCRSSRPGSGEYDPCIARVLDALDLDARGWVVLDDSGAGTGWIRIGARATPGRQVHVWAGYYEEAELYYYGLEIGTGSDPTEPLRDHELVETGYYATLDEVVAAAERHLDPNHEPDTRVRKDRTILALLARLDLDRRGWVLSDSWEDDSLAVGIGLPDNPYRRVWVATYQYTPGRYAYHCLTPTGPEPTDHKIVDDARDVSYDELVAAMERHLG